MLISHRDISLVVVSRAPLDQLEAYKKRMGWDFKKTHKEIYSIPIHVTHGG